ncbi:molecular chaperone DnaJ [Halomicrobium salinisoli]|uniref:molecular chaperone DnaJ n=1 Tax=Halomicrobium salinisoli TaxID=2878391 RepID=UPI001CF03B07|nr:molecular chaperone DnaJ [Halomicrobium salinisoli]
MSEDFYDVLGVSRDADEDDIKEAYRKKAREYHPDVSDDPDAEEKFKKVKKAKEVLTDDEKRQMYDQMGHERFQQAEKRGGVGGNGQRGGRAGGGDPFGGGGQGPFGDMGDIFDQFFGGGGSRSRGGQDLRTSLTIDLDEAYEGVEKELNVRRPETCPDCDGRGHPADSDSRTCPQCNGQGQQTTVQQTPMGRVQQTQTCRRCEGDGTLYDETCGTCGGDGVVRNEATLQIEVPAGIQDGQTIRMNGEGAPGERGAPSGDLLVEVSVSDHPDFERDGDDLKHRLAVSFPQVVFGDTVEVPTLDGAAEFEVPQGTQSGEVFRLEGKGMPRLRRRGHGDLYVEVQVVTPESLNEEQKEALEAFAEAGGQEIDVDEGFFEKIKNSL